MENCKYIYSIYICNSMLYSNSMVQFLWISWTSMEINGIGCSGFHGISWNFSIEFHLNWCPYPPWNALEIFSTEIDGIPWRYFLRYVPRYLKGLCHAIFYLFKKLKRVFESIEFYMDGKDYWNLKKWPGFSMQKITKK